MASTLKQSLESKDNLYKLIFNICSEYKLNPNLNTNILNIKSFLGPLNVDHIASKAKTVEEANDLIVKLYGKTIQSNRISIPDELNKTKQYMIKVLKTPGDDAKNIKSAYKDKFTDRKESFSGVGSILELNNSQKIEVVKHLNYQSLFRDQYITIDSRYQNKVNSDPTKIVFALIANSKTKSDHGGIILGGTIKDIIEIEVYPFTIPYKPVYVTFYNKITLAVNEWLSSSFEAYEGGQFHFCFDIERVDNNLIYLRPINKTYTFASPVNHIDDFSLSFGAVFPKIAFDSDRMTPKHIDYTNEYGLFSFEHPHNLVTGDLVYITGFDTPEPAKDNLTILHVNRSEGHIIVKKDNYSFIINVDLTAVRHEDPPDSQKYPIESFDQSVTVFFASKRIQIQMRLRYLTSYN